LTLDLCKLKNIIKILKKKLMGLNFKILVIWKALSTMPKVSVSAASVKPSAFGSVGSKATTAATTAGTTAATTATVPKAASQAAHVPASSAATKAASSAAPKPKSSGKGGDGGVDAAMAAMEARLNSRFDGIEAKVVSGFNAQRQLSLELQTQGNEAYAKTMRMFEMFGNMMTGGAAMAPRPELPAPPTLPAICAPTKTTRSKITEMHDERPSTRGGGFANEAGGELHSYMHSCFNTNEVGISSISSSQRSQSGAACGGGSASDSSRFAINKEPQTEFRSSSGGSTLVAARQLGVGQHLPKFEANFAKLDRNDFNVFAGATIRNFVAQFDPSQQDEMACVLLGMVNGKKYPAHNHIIIYSNESVFRQFFGELATKFPGNAVRITNNHGQKCGFPFKTVSTDQSAMWSLIRVLRGEE
jgi:hypothetical protein